MNATTSHGRRDLVAAPTALLASGMVRCCALTGVALAVALAGGAFAQDTATPKAAEPATNEKPAAEKPAKVDAAAARKAALAALEARYVVGPAAADDFGLRIVWQTEPLATKDAAGSLLTPGSDSYWFGDTAGSIVRVRRDNGETVWRSSTNLGLEKIIAIEHLPAGKNDNVFVLTDLGGVALDATTGNLVRRTRYSQLPSNVPAVYGPSMIYGTRTGLCSWFQYGTGYNWRATTLGGHVVAPVTVSGQLALVGSTNGTVLCMDAASAGVMWTRRLSAGVETAIAVDGDACFVAGRDQSLWAFDLMRGRVLWQYFTQTPLLHPPVRLADGLYLQIPGEGLVSFTPIPADKPDGEVRWKSKAKGDVIGRIGTELMAWDHATRTLTAVDAGTGRVIREASLPNAESIEFTQPVDGDLVVMSKDGSVERLEPLNRASIGGSSATMTPAAP